MTECRHFVVHGLVQGVYFRASARDRARALGLTGWVRNRPDGRVESLAWGPPAALDAYQEWLWQGPEAARVRQVEAHPGQDTAPPPDFDIR